MKNKNPDPPNELVEELIGYLQNSKLDKLLKRLDQLIIEYPKSGTLYNILGVYHKTTNDDDKAGKFFEKSYQLNKNDPNIINNFANHLRENGEIEKARELYNKLLKINDKFFQAYNNLGIISYEMEDYNAAITFFMKALKINPGFIDSVINLGNTFRETESYDKALDLYNQVLDYNPNHYESLKNRGILFLRKNQLDKALIDINKALKINPNNAGLQFNYSEILKKKKKYEEAITALELCIKIDPKFIDANYSLGLLYKNKALISKAISFYEKEIEINPDNHAVLFQIGESYIMIGDYEKSISYLERAVALDTDNSDYKTTLAVQHKISGNYKYAAKLFREGGSNRWKENELNCLYLAKDNLDDFYSKLDFYSLEEDSSPLISSIYSHAEAVFDRPNNYEFCKKPMDLIYKKNILEIIGKENSLIDDLLSDIEEMETDRVSQLLLFNGEQSAGNIFSLPFDSFKTLLKIIENEFINYKKIFSNSSSKFITNWPKEGEVKGWYIKMKKGGHLKRHMHEDGWISGTIYLEMPEKNKKNEGMIEFSLFCEHYLMDKKKDLKGHAFPIEKGDIVLFPSSLFHGTIPFNSDERRICIAFDFKPSYI